jgi:hypothetical protein
VPPAAEDITVVETGNEVVDGGHGNSPAPPELEASPTGRKKLVETGAADTEGSGLLRGEQHGSNVTS